MKLHKDITKYALENQIDQLVYKLYDLPPEEIEMIKGWENEMNSELFSN